MEDFQRAADVKLRLFCEALRRGTGGSSGPGVNGDFGVKDGRAAGNFAIGGALGTGGPAGAREALQHLLQAEEMLDDMFSRLPPS